MPYWNVTLTRKKSRTRWGLVSKKVGKIEMEVEAPTWREARDIAFTVIFGYYWNVGGYQHADDYCPPKYRILGLATIGGKVHGPFN